MESWDDTRAGCTLCISSCDFAFASRYQFCTDFSKELRVVESRLEAGRHCWMLWHWVLKLQPGIWWICSKVGQVLDSRFPHLPLEPWECWVSIEESSIIFQFVSVSSEFSVFMLGLAFFLDSQWFSFHLKQWQPLLKNLWPIGRVELRRWSFSNRCESIWDVWRSRRKCERSKHGGTVFDSSPFWGEFPCFWFWISKADHPICGGGILSCVTDVAYQKTWKKHIRYSICRKNLEPPSYINNSVRCNGVFPPLLLHSFIMHLQWLSPTSRACTVRRTGDCRVGSRFPILLEQFFSQNCALLMLSCWNATYKSQMQQLFEAPASWSIQKLKPWMFVKVAFRFLLGNDWLSQLMARC